MTQMELLGAVLGIALLLMGVCVVAQAYFESRDIV